MHYVKHFDILGIDTRQIPCIELQGIPTAATEGAVGVFGMNMLSADHEIYVCIAVDGATYTWIPLKGEGGVTITDAIVNESNELVITLSNGKVIMAGTIQGAKGEDAIPTLIPIEVKTTIDSDGFFYGSTAQLEVVGKRYRVVSPRKGTPGAPSLRHAEDVTKFHIILPVEIKSYKDYYTIEVFSVSATYNSDRGKWVHTIIYEVDGVEKSAIEECDEEYSLDSLALLFQDSVSEVYECNEDATLIGVKGDKGDKGDGVSQELINDVELLKQVAIQSGLMTALEVEQAYTSRVTANGESIIDGQKTPVKMIKGSTVKCENLLPFPHVRNLINAGDTFTNNGVTYTLRADGAIVANGTATENSTCVLFPSVPCTIPLGEYTISGISNADIGRLICYIVYNDGSEIDLVIPSTNSSTDTSKTVVVTKEVSKLYLAVRVNAGKTANNFIFKPMLNSGSTALHYQPYFTDLKHAYISGIKSTGSNLLPTWEEMKSYLYEVDGLTTTINDGGLFINGTFRSDGTIGIIGTGGNRIPVDLKAGTYTLYSGCDWGGSSGGVFGGMIQVAFQKEDLTNIVTIVSYNAPKTFTLTEDCKKVYVNMSILGATSGSNANNLYFKPMLTLGENTYEYSTSGKEDTYKLPKTIELGKWDSFNPQTGEITKATRQIIFTGEEDWTAISTSGNSAVKELGFNISPYTGGMNTTRAQATSNFYKGVTNRETFSRNEGVSVYSDTLYIYDENFNTGDISLWKSHLAELYAAGTPLIVEYILGSPTIEKLENVPTSYTAYNHGKETIIQGETDNSEYGAMATITNEYFKLTEV